MSFLTTDLCDANEQLVRIAAPIFRSFGANPRFSGQIVTLKLFEDNTLVRATLGTPGHGKVLVVDGGGSLRCALLGDLLGAMAVENGWAGLVIHGCIRDSVAINQLPLGVRALATHPKKSFKRGEGERDLNVTFAGIDFVPGQWLYADEDGLIVSPQALL